jgi:sterol desaturase/sphingolipid hydroxylase (fatty acid hydroxylase superfamily)
MHGITFGTVAATFVLVCAGGCEMARPWRQLRQSTARRWMANVTLYGLAFGLGYVMAPLVAAAAAAANIHLGLVERINGATLRIVLAIVCLDLLDYALHRASHRIALLWRIHQAHHSDVELDVTTALRHHPFEAAIASIVLGGGGVVLGFSTAEIASYGALAITIQLVAHANVVLPQWLTRLLAPVLVTPDFHRLHHSRLRSEADANYGQVFSFWDRLFGSQRIGDAEGIEFGVDTWRHPHDQPLSRLLAQPMLRG